MSEETLYAIRVNKHNSIVFTKVVDGRWNGDAYTITNRGRGACDCFGASRNPGGCKHRKMVEKLAKVSKEQNLALMGCFYDYDHDILYTPEDGEGVPLQGLIDIWGMAIEQGKAY